MNIPYSSDFRFYIVDTDTTHLATFIFASIVYIHFIYIYSIHAYIAMTVSFYVHEIGHYIAAKRFNIYIESVDLTVFGGSTLMENIDNPKHNLFVSLSGPVFGFLSLMFIYPYLDIFVNIDYKVLVISLCVILGNGFNLVPIEESDGYYILKSIKEIFFSRY